MNRIISCLIVAFAFLTPLCDEVSNHFLLYNRPTVSTSNKSLINTQGSSFKTNANSYKVLKHYDYDENYMPKTELNNVAFDKRYKGQFYSKDNVWKGIYKYTPTVNGITFNNHYKKVQLPIIIYCGMKYKFILNGHLITRKYIDYRLTKKTNNLCLKNIPEGKTKVGIRKANLRV